MKSKCGFLVFIPSYKEKNHIDHIDDNDESYENNPYPNL